MLSTPPPLPSADQVRRRLVLAGLGMGWLAASPSAAAEDKPRDLVATEQLRAQQRSELCSADNASGVGLRGEYFSAEFMRGKPILVRVDGPVNFDGSLDWPDDLTQQRPRSVRWSGWVKPPLAGNYRFHLADIPQARVIVAKRLLAGEGAAADAQIELAAGRFYPISVDLGQLKSVKDVVRLEWTAPYGSRFVIPRALLYVPTDTVDKPGG